MDLVVFSILQFLWSFLETWWWVFLPFLLFKPLVFLYLWWRTEVFYSQQPYILLEIKMPQEVTKPFKGMEEVFATLWQMYDPPNPRETWIEGKVQLSFSFEIASIEGDVHFYFRIPQGGQQLLESALFSQFPDAELIPAEDYTKFVPQDIPNKDWDLWGTNYFLDKPDVYPIKTYPKFFEESSGDKEETKVDPIAFLVEGLSKLGKGEQLWFQMVLTPITPGEYNYVEKGKEIVDRLVKRPIPAKSPSLMGDIKAVSGHLASGQPMARQEENHREEFIPPEMKLTPGEREIVASIENKISKYSYMAHTRFIYLARRENYFGPAKALIMSFFSQFSTANLNNFRPLRPTITKVHTLRWFYLDNRRRFLRKRKLFRNYLLRLPPFFPFSGSGIFLLNIEELATMIHFPGRITAPSVSMPRVGMKKGEAPPGLPTE